jgi:serine/threonine-protein kinase RsbW
VAVVYEPAEVHLEIGGDWYDAFWTQPDRRVALVVGDVVGRGLAAAATMGQLRSATRALIGTGLAPHEVLEALDAYGERHELADLATLVVAELDLVDGALRFACAGHPPPLLLAPDGQVQVLWEGRSPPLGAAMRARPLASDRLAAGATLALYTDGLYERRGESLATGLERLAGELADQAGAAPDQLATVITQRMLAGRHLPDDACLLVAGYGGASPLI